ncbi:MAG: LuxR C-terminal-related transcriptional regulator, partial [Acidimicrobiia bacterium]|nr:LuxR C-terminal-related transcriptional regulator [Acidimicrobiia bacterium]
MADQLAKGRSAAAGRQWADAYSILAEADQRAPLGADDLETLAFTSYMIGSEVEMVELLERAHHAHLDDGDLPAAARAAVWIGINLALRGEMGPSSGWFGRARRIVERHGQPCAEQGYLLVPVLLGQAMSGDNESAIATAAEAIDIGEHFGEPDLVALALHEQGRAMVRAGRVNEGLRLLDEAMVAVMSDDLTPLVTGTIYCSVIEGCHEVLELRRAHAWTEALVTWCGEQPDLVAFTGQCLTHRAELLQIRGEWDQALAEATRAAERFDTGVNPFPAAQAHYRQGELHRLRGAYDRAEQAYREAGAHGWSPQPGLSLLRMAQGEPAAAATAIKTALGEATQPLARAKLLPALVEISIHLDDVDAAASAGDELDRIASAYRGTMIEADSSMCRGSVLIARDSPSDALEPLGRARRAWVALDALYETARARVLMGEAYRMIGDDVSAELEIGLAREVFERLEARPDLDRLSDGGAPSASILTDREIEVLRLVATGKTSKAIADDLHVSVRTVDRHLSNIFTKL